MNDNVLNIENGLNPATLDYPRRTLDLKTTTINGVLKMVVEEVLFKKDSLKGITEFKGQIYRVTKTPVNSTTDSPSALRFLKSIFSSSDKSKNLSICKVRIPEIHGMLPIPSTFGTTVEDEKIIDLYPDFIIEPRDGNVIEVSIGSIVNTTFGNLTTFQEGKIINVFAEVPQGDGDIKPIGADNTNSPNRNLFNSKTNYNPVIKDTFNSIIDDVARVVKIDPNLIKAFIAVESNFNPSARSPAGAQGLMQLMPSAVSDFSKKPAFRAKYGSINPDPFKPEHNIMMGAIYLKQLQQQFNGDLEKMAAGYNWGPNRQVLKISDSSWKSRLPQETSDYIVRIPTAYNAAKNS